MTSSKLFFTDVLKKQQAKLAATENWSFNYCSARKKVAVIVEPRRHDMLAAVCANVMWYLGAEGAGWNLHIFTGRGGGAWVQDTVLRPLRSTANVTELDVDNLLPSNYSALLMSRAFWEAIAEPHVLIFQTDCILLRGGIENYVDYDYAGANYFNPRDLAPKIGGIQGGFSIRSRACMLECIERVSEESVNQYRQSLGYRALSLPMAEDVFFTHACEILNKRVLPPAARRYFSIEAEWYHAPIAFHGWVHDYFDHERNKKLVGYM